MTAPLTRPSGAPPPPATCRDCGGPLDPSDPPDVHGGAMACIRVLRQEVRRLGLVVDAARGKGAHAETIALEVEKLIESIREVRDDDRTRNWNGPFEELEPIDAALEAYRIDHPKAVLG